MVSISLNIVVYRKPLRCWKSIFFFKIMTRYQKLLWATAWPHMLHQSNPQPLSNIYTLINTYKIYTCLIRSESTLCDECPNFTRPQEFDIRNRAQFVAIVSPNDWRLENWLSLRPFARPYQWCWAFMVGSTLNQFIHKQFCFPYSS